MKQKADAAPVVSRRDLIYTSWSGTVKSQLSDLPMILVPHPHVRADAHVMGGSPYVVGSRVPVRRLWAFYRKGVSLDRLMKRYPRLGPGKILDALAFAHDNEEVVMADIARERRWLAQTEQPRPERGSAQRQMQLPFLMEEEL